MDKIKNALKWVKDLAYTSWVGLMAYWLPIFLLILFTLGTIRACHVLREKKEVNKETVQSFDKQKLDSTVTYWKDKYNKEHAIAVSLYNEYLAKDQYIDSIAKLLKIKSKNIQSVTITKGNISLNQKLTRIIDTLAVHDTFTVSSNIPLWYGFNDPWINVEVEVGGDKDSIHIEGVDTINTVSYWRRKKVLGLNIGKQEGYLDYSNKNPYVRITGSKQLTITSPVRHWSIGPSIMLGYDWKNADLRKPQFFFGISATYSVIKF